MVIFYYYFICIFKFTYFNTIISFKIEFGVIPLTTGHYIIDVIIKTTVAFSILLFFTRILGKKQISQLTFSHYITGITIGAIAGNIVSIPGKNPIPLLAGLSWWCFLTWLIEFINLKTTRIRIFLYGEPAVIIKNGKFNKSVMSSSRLNIHDLIMMLRQRDIFSITEVEYAILESNGRLSVLKKTPEQYIKKKDLNMKFEENPLFLPREVIVDGCIVKKNLENLNLTEESLIKKLKEYNIHKVSEVFYCEILWDGSLHIERQ